MNVNTCRPRRYWVLVLLSAIFPLSYPVNAQDVTGQINLISTIGGNPSLSPAVMWKVFRVNPHDRDTSHSTPIYTLNRHSISLNLTPGHYKVIVSLANIVKEQNFKIQAEDKHTLEVPVDGAKIGSAQ